MTSLGNRDFPEGQPGNPSQFEEQAGDPPEWQRTKSGKPASVPPGHDATSGAETPNPESHRSPDESHSDR